MRTDWSSFTSRRLAALPPYQSVHAPGYLVWAKIDHECLRRPDLGDLLAEEHTIEEAEASGDTCRIAVAVAKARIRLAAERLHARGIRQICTGVSWCDLHCMPGAPAWVTWYLERLAEHAEVLPRITYTPPPLTDGGKHTINAPPADPIRFAEFVDTFLSKHGHLFDHVELWNEWNLSTDWRPDLDSGYRRFAVMIAPAALVVHHHGKKVVLGGVAGVDEESGHMLADLARYGLFRYVDVVGFHNLRGTWSDDTPSPPISEQAECVRKAVSAAPTKHAWLAAGVMWEAEHACARVRDIIRREQFRLRKAGAVPDVWLTEYGIPVVDPEKRFDPEYLERIQVALFAYAADCIRSGAIDRVYWYTFQDFVGDSVRKHTTGWEDVLQHYYGDTCEAGNPRLLGRLLNAGGPEEVHRYALRHDLFPLVDAASLGRSKPAAYKSNQEVARDPAAKRETVHD